MGTMTITYPAKCKDCHFMVRYYGDSKRAKIKCINRYPKVSAGSFARWTQDQQKEAKQVGLKWKACNDFILFGFSEAKVQEIIKERMSDGK